MNRWFYSAVAAIIVLCAAAFSTLDLGRAQITQLVPVVSSGSLPANQAVQLIAPNPTRHTIRICNTGGTNALWIFPSNLPSGSTLAATATAVVSDYILAAVASSVITCYTPPTGAFAGNAGPFPGATNGWFGYSGSGTTAAVEEW
jgi:hypothetical protein